MMSGLLTTLRRLLFVAGLYIVAIALAWWNMGRLSDDVSVRETVGIAIVTSPLSQPLSAFHILTMRGDHNIIQIGGKPLLLLATTGISLLMLAMALFYLLRGSRLAAWTLTIYFLISAPYWSYYASSEYERLRAVGKEDW